MLARAQPLAVAAAIAAAFLAGCGDDGGTTSTTTSALAEPTCSTPNPTGIGGEYAATQAGPAAAKVDSDSISAATEVICKRAEALGLRDVSATAAGADRLAVSLPGSDGAERDLAKLTSPARIYFYDWEPNVVGDEAQAADGYSRLYDAVKVASTQSPECFQDECTTDGPLYYLFDQGSLELLAGPVAVKDGLAAAAGGEFHANATTLEVPQGYTVVAEPPPDTAPVSSRDPAAGTRYFILRDRPALSSADIVNPEAGLDPVSGTETINFELSEAGQQAFAKLTAAVARRGSDLAGHASGSPEELSQHFAIVFDGTVVSRPLIDYSQNPDGIDGSNGAQIGGSFTATEADELAKILAVEPLPVDLTLVAETG